MCQPIGKLISPTEPPRLITGGYLRFFDFNWSFPRPHKKPSDPKQARRRARSSEVGTEFFMSSFCFLEHLASVQDVSTYWGGFCEAFWELVPTAVSSCHFQGIQSTIRVSWTPTEQVGFKVGAASHPPLSRGSQSLRSVGPRGPPGPLGACKKSPGPGVACREVQEQADWQEKTGWERLDRCISGCFYGANGEILRAKTWAPSPIRQAFGLAWHVVNLVSRTPAEKQWKADYFDTFNSWVNCVHTQLISTASYIYNHIHSIHMLSYCYIY